MMDRDCPKHVEFYFKNEFEKLMNLVGFITGIYQDARSSECQTRILYYEKGLLLCKDQDKRALESQGAIVTK